MKPSEILIDACGASVVERIDIPPRLERHAEPPSRYREGVLKEWLDAATGGHGPWAHQAKALALHDEGRNVVLTTGTASGKSLAFQGPIVNAMLHTEQTALVFYPQKALSGDQLGRWQNAMNLAGIDPELVGEIHGDVPMAQRDAILTRSRVLTGTPDTIHAWLLRSVAVPHVQAFLARLGLIVIDEGHALEGVFGSNCAFFMRRLRVAAARARVAAGLAPREVQFIAASATIADPAGHLEALTGVPFDVIDDSQNGAPFHGLTLLHIEGPDHGTPAETMLAETIANLLGAPSPDAVIAFMDGRQAVERITQRIERDDVFPYRGGLAHSDRRRIEQGLHDGAVKAVVSTSALELGVDIRRFNIGLNQGVPATRKALRQRMGRSGRACEGAFAVIASASAFAKLGTSLGEFVSGGIEHSPLYLGNKLIQVQQACCLFEECGGEADLAELPGNVSWPEGFAEAYAMAHPGARRPLEIDQLLSTASGCPQIDYALRKIGGVDFALRLARDRDVMLGTIDQEKALREAFPGAIYRHLKKSYKVTEWRVSSFEKSILLEACKSGARTTPMLRTVVNVSYDHPDLLAERLLTSETGSCAETCITVRESVEGFALAGQQHYYSELAKTDRRKRRQQRQFNSTAIVLRINEPWFAGDAASQVAMRRKVSRALTTLLSSEFSVAAGDVRAAHTGIAIHQPGGPRPINDAIVIFDDVPGGLRLIEPLFMGLSHFLDRLRRGAALAGEAALLDEVTIDRLAAWYDALTIARVPDQPLAFTSGEDRVIFAPGSEVGVPIKGTLIERRLLGHELVTLGDCDHLAYRYETGTNAVGYVMHDQVQPIGQNWRHILWNPQTNAVREIGALGADRGPGATQEYGA